MSATLITYLMTGLILGGAAASARFGAWPERSGAAAIVLGVVLTQLSQVLAGGHAPILTFFVLDGALCLALLLICVKSGRFWAGLAACAQSLVVVFTAVRYFNFPLEGHAYLIALNGSGWLVQLSLWGGAAAYAFSKRRATSDGLAWQA